MKTDRVRLNIPDHLKIELYYMAKQAGVSASEYLRSALTQKIASDLDAKK